MANPSDTLHLSKRLTGAIHPPAALTAAQRARMYSLLADYFHNVSQAQFEADLAEKESVVILADNVTGKIQGFSTLMRLRVEVAGEPIVALFSGDTIIHRAYWGETELPRLWGRHVFELADSLPQTRVFWFLISSGYKTYRFLPVFFRDFYPTYRRPTPPDIQQILDAIARHKFPSAYDPATGLIRFDEAAPLKEGIAAVTERRLKDPHVAFFVRINPDYAKGDQLACLVELRRDNITAAGRRMLA